MALLKYNGPLPQAELVGYGHFVPGEEKTVDDHTAAQMDVPPCREEGWEVTYEGKKKKSDKSADAESTKPASDLSPRGPRNQATNDE